MGSVRKFWISRKIYDSGGDLFGDGFKLPNLVIELIWKEERLLQNDFFWGADYRRFLLRSKRPF